MFLKNRLSFLKVGFLLLIYSMNLIYNCINLKNNNIVDIIHPWFLIVSKLTLNCVLKGNWVDIPIIWSLISVTKCNNMFSILIPKWYEHKY